MTQESIQVFIEKHENGNFFARVRKWVMGDDGKTVCKYALTREGTWVIVQEGEQYPEDSFLPSVSVFPEFQVEAFHFQSWRFGEVLRVGDGVGIT